jgi:hypothetical protein
MRTAHPAGQLQYGGNLSCATVHRSDDAPSPDVSGWLRTPSPRLRRSICFVGVILAFFVAVGIGAAATVVVGWQFGPGATRPGGVSALEGTGLETTGPAGASESTGIEPSGDSNDSSDTAHVASFVHRADRENSRGDYTYISDASIDGNANAISETHGRWRQSRDSGCGPRAYNTACGSKPRRARLCRGRSYDVTSFIAPDLWLEVAGIETIRYQVPSRALASIERRSKILGRNLLRWPKYMLQEILRGLRAEAAEGRLEWSNPSHTADLIRRERR